MIFKNKLSVIDFQDARKGPPTYDLVSLCFDPYLHLSISNRLDMFTKTLDEILCLGGGALNLHKEATQWKAVLLQRLLKAIGSFEFLSKQKSTHNYIPYIKKSLDIMVGANLFDQRWPYLSKTLIEELQDYANV
jgi:hypothetical protein